MNLQPSDVGVIPIVHVPLDIALVVVHRASMTRFKPEAVYIVKNQRQAAPLEYLRFIHGASCIRAKPERQTAAALNS